MTKFAADRGHVALIIGGRIRRDQAALGDSEQQAIGMMPSMAALIVRRCGHATVWKGPPPTGLSFQLRAVAGRALLSVYPGAKRNPLTVTRVGARVIAGRGPIAAAAESARQRNDQQPFASKRHDDRRNALHDEHDDGHGHARWRVARRPS